MIADKTEMERDINVKREREKREEGEEGTYARRRTREREIERASRV